MENTVKKIDDWTQLISEFSKDFKDVYEIIREYKIPIFIKLDAVHQQNENSYSRNLLAELELVEYERIPSYSVSFQGEDDALTDELLRRRAYNLLFSKLHENHFKGIKIQNKFNQFLTNKLFSTPLSIENVIFFQINSDEGNYFEFSPYFSKQQIRRINRELPENNLVYKWLKKHTTKTPWRTSDPERKPKEAEIINIPYLTSEKNSLKKSDPSMNINASENLSHPIGEKPLGLKKLEIDEYQPKTLEYNLYQLINKISPIDVNRVLFKKGFDSKKILSSPIVRKTREKASKTFNILDDIRYRKRINEIFSRNFYVSYNNELLHISKFYSGLEDLPTAVLANIFHYKSEINQSIRFNEKDFYLFNEDVRLIKRELHFKIRKKEADSIFAFPLNERHQFTYTTRVLLDLIDSSGKNIPNLKGEYPVDNELTEYLKKELGCVIGKDKEKKLKILKRLIRKEPKGRFHSQRASIGLNNLFKEICFYCIDQMDKEYDLNSFIEKFTRVDEDDKRDYPCEDDFKRVAALIYPKRPK
ncbi:hypothetical protein J4530_07775 [Neisseria subflava]|uniref:hypothetical protein n=1 Tax=Neisseria subflava TaxID=28449 RepID=UPI00202AB5E7|nr:hypothetical protein [Neisseria subflava]MCL9788063.1 hypothetical protein [Neisseria subflava]